MDCAQKVENIKSSRRNRINKDKQEELNRQTTTTTTKTTTTTTTTRGRYAGLHHLSLKEHKVSLMHEPLLN